MKRGRGRPRHDGEGLSLQCLPHVIICESDPKQTPAREDRGRSKRYVFVFASCVHGSQRGLPGPRGRLLFSPARLRCAEVFAAITTDGLVHVYDLNMNRNERICYQKVCRVACRRESCGVRALHAAGVAAGNCRVSVVKRAKLTHVAFNPQNPILNVGDDRGGVPAWRCFFWFVLSTRHPAVAGKGGGRGARIPVLAW